MKGGRALIPREYIADLVQRNDIVDVVQRYVQLRRSGRTHTGLCPFHNEKTPSFFVYPETQSFYCFGCGAGGDVITFVQRIDNLDYVEAVKQLASRAGMALPDENDETGRLRSRVLAINKEAARWFFQCLNSDNGREARAYWHRRGLTDATIRRFGLGYAPDSFNATRNHLKSLGYTENELLDAGMCKRSEKGSVYDVFRNRVMIPIFDVRGNVVAFTGRNLGNEKPKYLNSYETLIYKKSRTLYLLNVAKKSTSRRYILCEGNMDAIALHQAGFTTAVAGCGTALTQEQVKLLSEYADELVLCFDSDEAGQKATARALQLLSNAQIKVSVLNIPDAKDPDEYIQKFGAERFEKLLDGSSNAVEYALKRAQAQFDITTEDGRVGYLRAAVDILADGLTPTEQDVYAGRLAREVNVEKQAVLTQLAGATRAKARRAARDRERRLLDTGAGARINLSSAQGGQKALGVAFAEQQLVGAILKQPEYLATAATRVTPQQFISADMASVYELLLARGQETEYLDLASISDALPQETVSLLSRILAQNYDITPSEKDVELYIDRIVNSVPESARAAEKSPEELAEYLNRLKDKKT